MIDPGVRARTLFGVAYVVAQVALVLTGPARPDRVFAFQMFNESSTIEISLARHLASPGGRLTTARIGPDGGWRARDAQGALHEHRWGDRVRDPIVGVLGRVVPASYGAEAQLFHLQKALDDVAAHLPDDAETVALVADVVVRRNGGAPVRVRLESPKRR